VDVYIHVFLILALVVGEWSAPSPGERALGIHWIGDGQRGENKKILPLTELEIQPLGCPTCSAVAIPTELSNDTESIRKSDEISEKPVSLERTTRRHIPEDTTRNVF
jgi:hypothetical protein